MDVERTAIDQVTVDRGVKEAVADGVVDMAVDIVVHPARRDAGEEWIDMAWFGDRSFAHAADCFIESCTHLRPAIRLPCHSAALREASMTVRKCTATVASMSVP